MGSGDKTNASKELAKSGVTKPLQDRWRYDQTLKEWWTKTAMVSWLSKRGNCKRRKQKMETENGNGKWKRKQKAEKGQGRHCNTYNVIVRHARPG